MQKIINFRAFLFIFLGIIIGTVFCLQILKQNLFFFVLTVIVSLGAIVALCFLYKPFKMGKYNVLFKSLFCFILSFIIIIPISFLSFNRFYNNYKDYGEVSLSGRVFSVAEKDEYNYVLLEDCYVTVEEEDEKLSGKVSVTLYSLDEEIEVGDRVFCKVKLKNNDLYSNEKFNSYAYKFDIRYNCYASGENFSLIKGNKKFDEICRQKVKTILFDNLSYDNAGIAYASLFGDKSMLDEKIYETFSVSGTAHLLCVSGLHVGFLVALIFFILKALKIKNKYNIIIITTILIFYCYLCGFAPSVVRASIMSVVLAYSNSMGKNYDSISSLCFAGSLILLIKPFYIFDVGFQLSFVSCFGIFLLMPLLNKFFKKINFYNKFSTALSLTASAQIATFPIILHNFEKMSFLSICANIIVVPLFSVLFSLLICFVIINLILPCGFLFKINEIGQNFIIFLTKGFVGIKELTFLTFPTTLFADLLFYFIIFLVSGCVNLKGKSKILTSLSICLVMAISFVYQFVPTTFNSCFLFSSMAENVSIVTNSYNEKLLIALKPVSKQSLGDLKNDLLSYKINKLDGIILLNYDEQLQESVAFLCNEYKADKIYLQNNISDLVAQNLFKRLNCTQIILMGDEQQYSGHFSFMMYNDIDGVFLNIVDKSDIISIMFLDSVDKASLTFINSHSISADILSSEKLSKAVENINLNFDHILCRNYDLNRSDIISISTIGDKFNIRRLLKNEI